MTIVCFHVDDLLVVTTPEIAQRVADELASLFKSSAPCFFPNHFLHWDIQYSPAGIHISGESYIRKMIKKMETKLLPSSTPFPHLLTARGSSAAADKTTYLRVVGQLNYLAYTSRPDISFQASSLGTFASDPSVDHLSAAMRTLRYVATTPTLGITYHSKASTEYPEFSAFSDSDWGGCPVDRRSISGNIIAFNGSPIDWSSSKQRCISLSSNEAELISLSSLSSSVVYLRDFMSSIGYSIPSFPIFVDNQPAIHYLKGSSVGRIKHAALRLFFVRDLCSSGIIDVKHISTESQPADILTKPMTRQKFFKCRANIPMD